MATFSGVRAAVKTILQSVSNLAFVYDYNEPNLAGYPAATFDFSAQEDATETNVENRRTYVIDIYLWQETTNAGLEGANDILDDTADAVVAAFESRTNLSLGGQVSWVEALPSSRDNSSTPQGLVRYQQITLRAHALAMVA